MQWVIDWLRSRVPAWGVVVITAAVVGAVSASLAVLALGRATDRDAELFAESEVEG